jgi:DNA-binding transcriptional LysR family regulator
MHREQLEYFARAYRHQSFIIAAEQVPMSAQGLAKAIHALETELGVPLFVVDTNGRRCPTAYADELMVFVGSFQHDYQHLLRSLERIRAQENNEIRLGSSLGILGVLGPDFLKGFTAAHPKITVVYNELADALCEAKLVDGSYDLAFTLAPFTEKFVTTALRSYGIYFWVNRSDALSQSKTLRLEDLGGRVVSIPGKDFKVYRTIIEEACLRGHSPAEVMPSSEIFWIYDFVVKNKGIGFTTEPLTNLSAFCSHEDVVPVFLEGVTWDFGISYLPSHCLTPSEQQLYNYCVSYAQQLSPSSVNAGS